MSADPSFAEAVAARLAQLRARYVPMTADETRLAMDAGEAALDPMSSAAVAHRLEELRALLDLAEHLHRARPGLTPPEK